MAVMAVSFHPHVASSFTRFFRGVVRVGMRHCVMAVVTVMVSVAIIFHPNESACFTVCFVVDGIVCMA